MKGNISIVIGSWGSYNECNERALGSKWLDLSDYSDWDEIVEELKKEGFELDGIDEELFIQDVEGIEDRSVNWDYVNPETLFNTLKESGVLDDDYKYKVFCAFLEVRCFDDFEEKLLKMEYDKMERYLRRKKREVVQTEVSGLLAGVVYAESYLSELGSELGKEFAHLDYIAIMNMGGRRISLRTVHDHVDVSEIAAKHGGGGHAKAAGCSLTDTAYKEYVADTFPLAPLREDAKRNQYNVKHSSFGALYHGNKNDAYLLYPKGSEWRIDHNGETIDARFKSFDEGDHYLKRTHAAWLVKDDEFVEYLMKQVQHRG